MDFGSTPLANTYGVHDKFPLEVNLCDHCWHMQLSQAVDPDILYKKYFYCSGTSQTAKNFFREFAFFADGRIGFKGSKSVLDIACNDGSQLDAFKAIGYSTYGCDPADNLAEVARNKGHWVRTALFESDTPSGAKYDIITAQNVLAHTSNPLLFLQKAKECMHENTKMFVMTSQADMVHRGECDTIYHEHISYFNANSMMKLANRAGLVVQDIVMSPIHGESYIFILGKEGKSSDAVLQRLDLECFRGQYRLSAYVKWRQRSMEAIERLKEKIAAYRRNGFPVIGISAAAKGISMLNMAGVKLDCLYDTTPIKQGQWASGMLIRPFEDLRMLGDQRVLMVILAWNFEKEIKENVAKFRNNPLDVFTTCK